MPYTAPKTSVKEVRYLNKDFSSFKANLIEFAKVYFPNTYNDFNEASPGMMFIEMASYVGDVLSYYIDNQFKESLLAFAEEKRTVYNMAQTFGYKPKLSSPAIANVDVFQTVPAVSSGTGTNYVTNPDLNYSMIIKSGMQLQSQSGIKFTTTEDCNFKFSSSYDPKPKIQPSFKGILQQTKDLVSKNNAKLYFVYLPEYNRYKNDEIDQNYQKIREIVKELDIPLIDINEKVFALEPNPLNLFPFGFHGHYNIDGYKRVAEEIYKISTNK